MSATAQSIRVRLCISQVGKYAALMSDPSVQEAPAASAARNRLQLPANGSNTMLPCIRKEVLKARFVLLYNTV